MRALDGRMQRAVLAVAGTLTLAVGALTAAGPAVAAPGVIGRLEHATVEQNLTTCPPEDPCHDYFSLKASGWAYNGSTVPSQEVFVRFRSRSNTNYYAATSAFVANRSRPLVARQYHLHTDKVGYAIDQAQGNDLWAGGPGLACAYARDHGTGQAWRQVGCVNFSVT